MDCPAASGVVLLMVGAHVIAVGVVESSTYRSMDLKAVVPVFFTVIVSTVDVLDTYVADAVVIIAERLLDDEPTSPKVYAATPPAMASVITIARRMPMRFEIPDFPFLLIVFLSLNACDGMPYRKCVCLKQTETDSCWWVCVLPSHSPALAKTAALSLIT